MIQQNTIAIIRTALGKMLPGNLTEASTQLLAALGYRSDRLLDGQTGNVSNFIADFKADNIDTRSEQDFRDSAKEVRILFQFTETEIAAMGQMMLLDAEAFSSGNASSFLFAAVDLNGNTYPRGQYVSFTREINKRFNRMPAAVVFRTADGRVTLAFVNRRPSKIRDDRQVLGSVSLIREVNPTNPHRSDGFGNGGRVNIYVTHDAILAALVGWLFRLPVYKEGWPDFLDGMLLWRDAGRLHSVWRGLHQTMHPPGS